MVIDKHVCFFFFLVYFLHPALTEYPVLDPIIIIMYTISYDNDTGIDSTHSWPKIKSGSRAVEFKQDERQEGRMG